MVTYIIAGVAGVAAGYAFFTLAIVTLRRWFR